MQPHRIVSRHEWLEARRRLLRKERDVARALAKLAEERRRLPWVKIEKHYEFAAPNRRCSLEELFAGRSQLIVQHFMFAPGWREGCVGCSFLADHVDAARMHFEHHDVSFAAISRAPLAQLQAFKRRMGWRFCWVSSFGSDFNYDFHVSFTPEQVAQGRVYYDYDLRELPNEELPGVSVFHRDAHGDLYHTYSAYGQGTELLLGAYNYLELTPKGRNETGPNFDLTDWVRHHDRYGQQPRNCGCGERQPAGDDPG